MEHAAKKHSASERNPILAPLKGLVGQWRTTGTHPYLSRRTLHGRASFEWIEGAAFLLMRTEMDAAEIPNGVAIFGADDQAGECFMLYFDERGVSRKYDVEIRTDGLVWTRNHPAFAQRFTLTMAADGRSMVGRGEMSREKAAWEPDLELVYARA